MEKKGGNPRVEEEREGGGRRCGGLVKTRVLLEERENGEFIFNLANFMREKEREEGGKETDTCRERKS